MTEGLGTCLNFVPKVRALFSPKPDPVDQICTPQIWEGVTGGKAWLHGRVT